MIIILPYSPAFPQLAGACAWAEVPAVSEVREHVVKFNHDTPALSSRWSHRTILLSTASLPSWQRQLAVALVSELALWDPEVIALGAPKPLTELLSPAVWLASLAKARGWSSTENLKSPLAQWRGLRQPFEGQFRTHSAWRV